MSDVVIVGAGLAGLVAARELVRAGLDVTVVEARDRVGGRTQSTSLGGQQVDLGAQWMGDAHHRLRTLASELGVETFPQHARGKKRLDRDGVVHTFSGFLPRLPLLALAELGVSLYRLERAARQVPAASPRAAVRAAEWDRQSLADWLDRHVRRTPAREMIELASQMLFAAEPRELSFLFFLLYVRSGEGLRRLAEIEDGAQERRFVTGAQELALRLAAPLGERVKLEHPVHAIEQDGDAVTVRTSGGTFQAPHAIVAAPPNLLAKIAFTPALPSGRTTLHGQMPAGSVIKCIAAYTRPFWRDAGFSGEAFSPRGLVRATFDDSSADGSHAALVAFVVGDAARELARRPESERQALVVAELARLHGPAAATPTGYVDKNWLADEWSGGCYVGTLGPGLLTQVPDDALRAPAGRLHFAGTETAVEHMGYLEGAIESGQRAAAEVIALRASRTS